MCTTVVRAGIRRSFWPVWFQLLAIFSAFARYSGECFMFIYAFLAFLNNWTAVWNSIVQIFSSTIHIFIRMFYADHGQPFGVFQTKRKTLSPLYTFLSIVISTHFIWLCLILEYIKLRIMKYQIWDRPFSTCENNFRVAVFIVVRTNDQQLINLVKMSSSWRAIFYCFGQT